MTEAGSLGIRGEDAVRRMVTGAFPHWARLPLVPVASAGTDHLLWRLGADMVVRIPANRDAAGRVAEQAAWLERFRELPLEVPRVLGLGPPDAECPWHWSVLGWIEGEDAAHRPPTDWRDTAVRLGRFIAALREIDTAGGLPANRANALRGAPLAELDAWMRPAIGMIADLYDTDALTAHWQQALDAPGWQGDPVWIHGDLHASNLLLRGGALLAVVDFGLMALGDPACDLAPAWTFLPAAERDVFRAIACPDDAAWRRGKGWGLYAGVIALAHYRDRNPVLCRMARRAIEAVLDS